MIQSGGALLEKLAIDFQRKEPIYYQIEEQIRFLIASGQILPGEQLPAVREMAEALDVNFNTIARLPPPGSTGHCVNQHGAGAMHWSFHCPNPNATPDV